MLAWPIARLLFPAPNNVAVMPAAEQADNDWIQTAASAQTRISMLELEKHDAFSGLAVQVQSAKSVVRLSSGFVF